MELQSNSDNLGILFVDPVSKDKDQTFREYYVELFRTGDYIKNYSHIKDCISVENSDHSVGIQMSDFISGATNSILKEDGRGFYKIGVDMFKQFVYPNLRKGWGKVLGYGIREVPGNSANRIEIWTKITDNMK